MRVASLIIALLAGLAGTAAIAFGAFDELVPVLIGLGAYPPGVARLAIALPPAIVLLAAGLALAAPFLSAFLLLAAGLGWVAGLLLARQSGLLAAVLLAATALAFILALIGGFRRRRDALEDQQYEAEDFEPEPVRPLLPTERLARSAYVPAASEPRLAASPPVEADEEGLAYLPEPEDAAPPADAPDEEYYPAEPALEPNAEAEPAVAAPGPDRDYFGEPRLPVRPFEPYDPHEARGGGWRRALIVANVLLILVLIGGAGVLVYLDRQRGEGSLLFGEHGLFNQIDLSLTPAAPPAAGGSPTQMAPSAPPNASAAASTPASLENAALAAEDAGSGEPGRKVSNPDVSPLAPPIPQVAAANTAPDQPTTAEAMTAASAPAFTTPETAMPPTAPAASPEPQPAALRVAANETGPGAAALAPLAVQQASPAERSADAEPSSPLELAALAPNDPDAPIPAPPLPDRVPKAPPRNPAPQAAPPAAPAQPSGPTAPANSASPAPAAATSPGPTYSDPFAYCEAVDTIDAPDSRYTGPAVPQRIAARLGATSPADIANTHWRCMSRNVLACRVTGKSPVCDKLPTVDAMIAYCKANRSTGPMLVAAGDWSCKGGVPVIPKGQSWPVDRRGFFPPAWTPVPNIAAANG